ncbi:MAG: hypothetical protein LBQ61_06395 [Spirochaetales bacterium]|jgi:hypothetical protein|nr:hypothetical protein [Spirochaetales bacterium]
MRRGLFLLVLLSLGVFKAPAQGWGGFPAASLWPLAQAAPPEEYAPGEFPSWLSRLRRGEIIFFGSLPFTLLFSSFGYRGGRYLYHNLTAQPGETVPGFNELDAGDHWNIVGISLGLSLSMALADYFLSLFDKD